MIASHPSNGFWSGTAESKRFRTRDAARKTTFPSGSNLPAPAKVGSDTVHLDINAAQSSAGGTPDERSHLMWISQHFRMARRRRSNSMDMTYEEAYNGRKFALAMLLACTGMLIMAITDFDERHVFADPGIVPAKAHNLTGWSALASRHLGELVAGLFPFASSGENLVYALVFLSPAVSILLWPAARRFHSGILTLLALLVMCDMANLLSFNGNNSANGGYDGAGDTACYGLHLLVCILCGLTIAVRWAWVAIAAVAGRR
jgi:hypothetical protein